MSDVFISYSRKDKVFVQRLHDALLKKNQDTWVDWEDIPPTADWWQEIERGIEGTSTFVFVISFDSIESDVCYRELDHAVNNNKRLVPIVYREDFEAEKLHSALSRHNWLFFREQDAFDRGFELLLQVIATDLEHVKTHTRLLERSLEWERSDRSLDLLLRGAVLEQTMQWLTTNTDKEPKTTALQREYVNESRKVELTQSQVAAERQQRFLAGVSGALVVAIISAGAAFGLYRQAEGMRRNAELVAQSLKSASLLDSDLQIDALLEGLRVGQQLKQGGRGITPETQIEAITALRQAVYGVTERNRLEGHNGGVNSVSFSPDGKTIATGSNDNTVKLWSLDGKELKTLEGHRKGVNSVSFSPDGKTIATASTDNTVKLWNLDGKELKTLEGHSRSVNSVSFSPDGKIIATGSDDNTVKLWNFDGKELTTLKGHSAEIRSVSFSPDGKIIATGINDNTVKLWSLDGKELTTLKGHRGGVKSVVFSPDGQTIATGSDDNTVKLWSLDSKELTTLKGHSSSVNSVSFSPDGKMIATGSNDNTVKIWSLDGKELAVFKGRRGGIRSVVFSPDGQTIATGSDDNSGDNTVKLWSLDGKQLITLEGHRNAVNSVSFSFDGKMIVTGSFDNTVKLWSLDGKELITLKGHNKSVKSVSFSPDGKVIATGSNDNTVKLWSLDGKELKTLEGHRGPVWSVGFSPDGKMIATGSLDNLVKLWSLDGKQLTTLKGHRGGIYSVSFSPDGKMIATGSRDNTVKLWSLGGKQLVTLKGHRGGVNSVSFSPDGKVIATGSTDNTVKLWSLDGKQLTTLKGHTGWVNSVSFSSDGKIIATGSTDNTVKLWSRKGKELTTLKGHNSSVNSVSFSPDGRTIATGSSDNTAKLWNLDLDRLIAEGCTWLDSYLRTHPDELETLEICQTPENRLDAAAAWVQLADRQASNGNSEQALLQFRKARKWDERLNAAAAEKEKQLQKLAQDYERQTQASRLVEEANALSEQKQFSGAIEKLTAAQQLLSKAVSAQDWKNICWTGSLQNRAAEVLPACEKAVAPNPQDGGIRDSRGVARAMTGDFKGAIEDFQSFLQWSDDQKRKARRQRWIDQLQKGQSPFTPEELKSISNQ